MRRTSDRDVAAVLVAIDDLQRAGQCVNHTALSAALHWGQPRLTTALRSAARGGLLHYGWDKWAGPRKYRYEIRGEARALIAAAHRAVEEGIG